MTDWQQLDDQVAAMLEAGETYASIRQQLNVGDHRIKRVRLERRVMLPPGRARLTVGQPEVDDSAPGAPNLVHAETKQQVSESPLVDEDTTTVLVDRPFRSHRPKLPPMDPVHILGVESQVDVERLVDGRKYNARAVAFRKHHGRAPEGRVWRTCDQPACIAGAHHTDRLIREAQRTRRPA